MMSIIMPRTITPKGTKLASSLNVQLPCLQKDPRTGSISWDIVNFPSELCRRRSGMFAEVARFGAARHRNVRQAESMKRNYAATKQHITQHTDTYCTNKAHTHTLTYTKRYTKHTYTSMKRNYATITPASAADGRSRRDPRPWPKEQRVAQYSILLYNSYYILYHDMTYYTILYYTVLQHNII